MAIVKVVPAEGARIRQPNRNSRVMPKEGDFVDTNDVYYSRLIASKDLEVIEGEKPPVPEVKETKRARNQNAE